MRFGRRRRASGRRHLPDPRDRRRFRRLRRRLSRTEHRVRVRWRSAVAPAERRSAAVARTAEGCSWKAWAQDLDEHLQRHRGPLWPKLFILGGGVSKNSDKLHPRLPCRTRSSRRPCATRPASSAQRSWRWTARRGPPTRSMTCRTAPIPAPGRRRPWLTSAPPQAGAEVDECGHGRISARCPSSAAHARAEPGASSSSSTSEWPSRSPSAPGPSLPASASRRHRLPGRRVSSSGRPRPGSSPTPNGSASPRRGGRGAPALRARRRVLDPRAWPDVRRIVIPGAIGQIGSSPGRRRGGDHPARPGSACRDRSSAPPWPSVRRSWSSSR